jgi:hypothetical protein
MEPELGVRRELDAVAARPSAETEMPYTPPAGGEMVAGIYQQPLTLPAGRYGVIDNGHGFALVPWTPDLEHQRGRHAYPKNSTPDATANLKALAQRLTEDANAPATTDQMRADLNHAADIVREYID